jgi:hypothetical protein
MIGERARRLLPAVLVSLVLLLGFGPAAAAQQTAGEQTATATVAAPQQHTKDIESAAPAAPQFHQSGQGDREPPAPAVSAEPVSTAPAAVRAEAVPAMATEQARRSASGQGSRAPPGAGRLEPAI